MAHLFLHFCMTAKSSVIEDNPSAWQKRIPIILLAFVGFCIALYLGLYQIHKITNVWEPFFGTGAEKVLHSKFSQMLPFPDAIMGAGGYALDLLLGSIGGEYRWQTKPWATIFFAAIVTMMAITALFLVFMQLVIMKAACTLCLCLAVLSWFIVKAGLTEAIKSLKYLKRVNKMHLSMWNAFWGNQRNKPRW